MNPSEIFVGIDPGGSGGICFLSADGRDYEAVAMQDTERDTCHELEQRRDRIVMCTLERVHSMPGQGVHSMFKFGQSYGFICGLLIALQIPFEDCPPPTWQRYVHCLTQGDK